MLDTIGLKYLLTKEEFDHSYKGGDKTSAGKNFVEYYEKIFAARRNEKLRFLEIGIWTGCSIAMWSDYFFRGTIYGIDINLNAFQKCHPILLGKGAFENKEVTIHLKNQLTEAQFLEETSVNLFKLDTLKNGFAHFAKNRPPFDIVLDDGNHTSESQYRNFKLLFHRMNPQGIYIIEDIERPKEFFSYDYFGAIIFLVNGQSVDSVRQEYTKFKQQKHNSECTNLRNKLAKLNSHIEKAKEGKIEFLINSRQKLEESLQSKESIEIEVIIQTQFDHKLSLSAQIDKIENLGDHIIFFKK